MTVTQSKVGWLFLIVGVVSACVMAAVAATNTQNPGFSVMLALGALVAYVAIFELVMAIKATTRPVVVAIAGAGLVLCFVVLIAVGNAVTSGYFSMLPDRITWWALPLAIAGWSLRELWERKKVLKYKP